MLNQFFKLKKYLLGAIFLLSSIFLYAQQTPPANIDRTITVEIAAINQPWMFNRLGVSQPTGLTYALLSDIEPIDSSKPLGPGNARLREGKRARPIVIRANIGDKIKVSMSNFLPAYNASDVLNLGKSDDQITADYVAGDASDKLSQQSLAGGGPLLPPTRTVGFHSQGMEFVNSIDDGGSYVGTNDNALAQVGETKVYTLLATESGTFLINSMADVTNHTVSGLFGSITVQPMTAEWYRSQTSREDLFMSTKYWVNTVGGTTTYYDYKGNSSKTVPASSNYATTLSYADVPTYVNKDIPGYPVIDYDATFPSDHPLSHTKKYILHMLDPDTHELLYTDLTAMITGPNQGKFTYKEGKNAPLFAPIPATPNRDEPYREIVVHYHETPDAIQAFPAFYDPAIKNTLNAGGTDAFGINYGTAGIGAEIYANRIGVGPMADCIDCEYEEFFLSSWAVGDPSMVVDVPANVQAFGPPTDGPVSGTLQNQTYFSKNGSNQVAPVATQAYFPDDPSNVYHSYIWDHVIFRITHAGINNPHVHHQHAHQWLHTQNSDDGHYLDSQVLSPAGTYSLEMVYNGSGNKNLTPGDQIFHCHFYPHFAAGMWAMWRVHDVLEKGTELDADGKPITGARALPDGEIALGTPIPALIPLPTKGMAPLPSDIDIEDGQVIVKDATVNPGFPFFIPGYAGSRPPHPPMDFAIENKGTVNADTLDGGLPRHLVVGGTVAYQRETPFDWTKMTGDLDVIELPFDGTPVEKAAMDFHKKRTHNTFKADGSTGTFTTNGRPPAPGAPYADPAVDIEGHAENQNPRQYKAAVMQMDVVFNREGWHYPQQRFISLWGDVSSTVQGIRPPQPFFFRVNSEEYVEFWHTNLVPQYYELDHFQVRTPTDIIGQHIHLVKFDVTSSDGAENGFNYEDGTFSPDAVRETIRGINDGGYYKKYSYSSTADIKASSTTDVGKTLTAKPAKAVWGTPPSGQDWTGAQTTIQRWYADSLLNNAGFDRTLRTVFSHDHFGPSTHQQIGLYAGMLIEPAASKWYNPNTGEQLGTANNGTTREVYAFSSRTDSTKIAVSDGGPTDWKADIHTADTESSYREFALEFQDRALTMYPFDSSKFKFTPYPEYETFVSNPTAFRDSAEVIYHGYLPENIQLAQDNTGGNALIGNDTVAIAPPGSPNIITSSPAGTYSVNYRNELITWRVNPDAYDVANTTRPSPGDQGDLAFAFSSQTQYRENPRYQVQPPGGTSFQNTATAIYPEQPLTAGMQPGDPFTPLMRAYPGDNIQIRTLVGGHQLPHYFNIQGQSWHFEPNNLNSGFRATQYMGISEHFEMEFQLPRYAPVASAANGTADYLWWADASVAGALQGTWGILRSYQNAQSTLKGLPNNPVSGLTAAQTTFETNFAKLKSGSTTKVFNVVATTAHKALDSAMVRYSGTTYDSTALLFVLAEDLDDNGKLKAGVPVEPLILRAKAGEFIQINLTNQMDLSFVDGITDKNSQLYKAYSGSQTYNTATANSTSSHNQTANFNTSGRVSINAQLVEQVGVYKDAALTEPIGKAGTVGMNIGNDADQTIGLGESKTYLYYAGKIDNEGNGTPVEFGSANLIAPDPINHYAHGLFGALIIEPANTTAINTDPNSRAMATVTHGGDTFRELVLIYQDGNSKAGVAFNYSQAEFKQGQISGLGAVAMDSVFANITYGNDQTTPTFAVKAGTPARVRIIHAGGTSFGQDQSFILHGHVWQEEPYTKNSTVIGDNPESNHMGSRQGIGAHAHYDIIIDEAGGENSIAGDYLYRSWYRNTYNKGQWGVMRVTEGDDAIQIMNLDLNASKSTLTINGNVTVNTSAATPTFTDNMKVEYTTKAGTKSVTSTVDTSNGNWSAVITSIASLSEISSLTLTSGNGGTRTYTKEELQDNLWRKVTTTLPAKSKKSKSKRSRSRSRD